MSSTDPADVVPDGLTLDELRRRENSNSSTPMAERDRCPNCESTDVISITHKRMAPKETPHDYRCGQCCHKFDEPVRGER